MAFGSFFIFIIRKYSLTCGRHNGTSSEGQNCSEDREIKQKEEVAALHTGTDKVTADKFQKGKYPFAACSDIGFHTFCVCTHTLPFVLVKVKKFLSMLNYQQFSRGEEEILKQLNIAIVISQPVTTHPQCRFSA